VKYINGKEHIKLKQNKLGLRVNLLIMNKEWSEFNKTMQAQIKKKDTYEEGISTLFDLPYFPYRRYADFSRQLNLQELYSYIFEVKDSTEKIMKSLSYGELPQKISGERKECLK